MAGNFHFAPGKSFHQANFHVLELLAFQMDNYNVRHTLSILTIILDLKLQSHILFFQDKLTLVNVFHFIGLIMHYADNSQDQQVIIW